MESYKKSQGAIPSKDLKQKRQPGKATSNALDQLPCSGQCQSRYDFIHTYYTQKLAL